jgi:hypothetical protein
MDTYIVRNIEDFNKVYHLLKSSAAVGSIPERYMVGFDIEYISKSNHRESFDKVNWVSKSSNIDNVVCLIQIATSTICLIIHLPSFTYQNIISNRRLVNLITKDSWIKVGIGIDNDLNIVSQNLGLGQCGGGIELVNICLLAKISKPNLISVYNRVFNDNIDKDSSICDWSQFLDERSIEYAARDGYYSYMLGKSILQPAIDKLANISKSDGPVINIINRNISPNQFINYVGKLGEYAIRNSHSPPSYIDANSCNNDEYKFVCECKFLTFSVSGYGNNKKTAKQNAAKLILDCTSML